jgi:hypothetical protein
MWAATSPPERSPGAPVYVKVNRMSVAFAPFLLSQMTVLCGLRSVQPTKSQPEQPLSQGFTPVNVPLPVVLKRPNAEKPTPLGGAPPLIELRISSSE